MHEHSGSCLPLHKLRNPLSHGCCTQTQRLWSGQQPRSRARPALCMSAEKRQRPRIETNPLSHKECLALLLECQLPGVKNVALSPDSCLLRTYVTITFLYLSVLWSKIYESLIAPGDAMRTGKTMPTQSCEESYSESYMMTRCIIKTLL